MNEKRSERRRNADRKTSDKESARTTDGGDTTIQTMHTRHEDCAELALVRPYLLEQARRTCHNNACQRMHEEAQHCLPGAAARQRPTLGQWLDATFSSQRRTRRSQTQMALPTRTTIGPTALCTVGAAASRRHQMSNPSTTPRPENALATAKRTKLGGPGRHRSPKNKK